MPCFPRVAVGLVTLAWLSSFAIPIVVFGFVVIGRWELATILCMILGLVSMCPIKKSAIIREFLLDGIAESVGGVTIIRNCENEKMSDKILYAIHPHGLTSTLAGFALSDTGRQNLGKVGMVVAPMLRWFNPFMRLLMALMGIDLISSNKKCVRNHMRQGLPLGIVVGGFEEMLQTEQDRDIIYLKNRRGFLKEAILNGYRIVPVYCFGETQIYRNRVCLGRKIRDWCAKWKIPAVVPVGNGNFSFMPRRLPGGTLIAFGAPLRFDPNVIHNKEDFERVHGEYSEALKTLYYKYNPFKGRKLEIV